MTKMKIDYHSISTWDFDGLTPEQMIENLNSKIESEKSKFGDAEDTVVTVCDLGEYYIKFRFERPMTEAEIIAEKEYSANVQQQRQQRQTERDRKVFEQFKEKYGW